MEQPNNETEAEVNAVQALFSGQRMEKGNLVHRSTSCPCNERDLILKSKDKGRRSEANDGEAYALVYQGRDRVILREWDTTPFLSFFGP